MTAEVGDVIINNQFIIFSTLSLLPVKDVDVVELKSLNDISNNNEKYDFLIGKLIQNGTIYLDIYENVLKNIGVIEFTGYGKLCIIEKILQYAVEIMGKLYVSLWKIIIFDIYTGCMAIFMLKAQ